MIVFVIQITTEMADTNVSTPWAAAMDFFWIVVSSLMVFTPLAVEPFEGRPQNAVVNPERLVLHPQTHHGGLFPDVPADGLHGTVNAFHGLLHVVLDLHL